MPTTSESRLITAPRNSVILSGDHARPGYYLRIAKESWVG